MKLNLDNKVAVITGASQGIGRAIAQTLSHEGMRLVIAARSEELLKEVALSCNTEVMYLAIDLRDKNTPQQLIDAAIKKFGSIDLLVNNAGATKRGDFLELSDDDWKDGFALKFFSTMRCSKAAWPHLQASKGSIINIIGIGGRTGHEEFAIGGAVNAALLNLTKVLACRASKDDIRVNAINPGSIATERLHNRIHAFAIAHNMDAEIAKRKMAQKLGISRFGEPEEIAQAVAFLASPAARFCQGTILDIDGGETKTL